MKTIVLFAAVIVSFSACNIYQNPVSSQHSANNADYKVDYLFEHEGCKVYRFYDRGNYVYFTNCKGEAIAMTDSTAVRNMTNMALKNVQSRVGQ